MKEKEMKKEYCRICHKLVVPEIISRKEKIEFRDELFEIDSKVAVCPLCHKEEFIVPEADDVNLRTLQSLYREKHNRLSVEEIIRIREKYSRSQTAFAKVIGVGEKTVTRYENGFIPDESINNLILLADTPGNFRRLFEKNKKALTEREQQDIREHLAKIKDSETIELKDVSWYQTKQRLESLPRFRATTQIWGANAYGRNNQPACCNV